MDPMYIVIAAIVIGIGIWAITNFFMKSKNKKEGDIDVKPGDPSRKPIKKALLVGINRYKPELNADLKGCVNDVQNMRELLVKNFGFDPENIRVVADDRATRQNILARLKWLIDGSIAGDELVFHYSGHGSQVRDRNGDELNDHLDEILCPYDLDWNNPLTDDILADMLRKLPKGVFFTMVCDSCHSGTMTRGARLGNPHAELPRYIKPPFDIMARSMDRDLSVRKIGEKPNRGKKDTGQNHVLMSGCKDNQTSADAFIDNKYQGAMTWALTTVIKDNPGITWTDACEKVVRKLANNRYSQIPQLSGNDNLTNRETFGGK